MVNNTLAILNDVISTTKQVTKSGSRLHILSPTNAEISEMDSVNVVNGGNTFAFPDESNSGNHAGKYTIVHITIHIIIVHNIYNIIQYNIII